MYLTERQAKVLQFIVIYHGQHGYSPSYREIQEHFGFSSTTAVMGHLKALEKKGKIKITPKINRSIVIL